MKKLLIIVVCMFLFFSHSLVQASSVKNIRSQGSTSSPANGESWLIECSSGTDVVVYRSSNGEWATGGLGAMGGRYNNYSLEELADYLCNK
jgi:hypothetical protein